jgi:hypothetical protein
MEYRGKQYTIVQGIGPIPGNGRFNWTKRRSNPAKPPHGLLQGTASFG